jgi:hypothetical protein
MAGATSIDFSSGSFGPLHCLVQIAHEGTSACAPNKAILIFRGGHNKLKRERDKGGSQDHFCH